MKTAIRPSEKPKELQEKSQSFALKFSMSKIQVLRCKEQYHSLGEMEWKADIHKKKIIWN